MRTDKNAPRERKPFYWDSCLFIDLIGRTGGYLTVLDQMCEAAKQKEIILVTSALTLAEVLGRRDTPAKPGGPNRRISEEEEQKVIAFFKHEYISIRPFDRFIGEEAGRIARKHSLWPRDAIHVATAVHNRVPVLQTTDGQKSSRGLLNKNGKIGAPPLKIELPTWAAQMRLIEPGQTDQKQSTEAGGNSEPETPDVAETDDARGVREGPPVSPEGGG